MARKGDWSISGRLSASLVRVRSVFGRFAPVRETYGASATREGRVKTKNSERQESETWQN